MKTLLTIMLLVLLFSCEEREYVRCYHCTTIAIDNGVDTLAVFTACSSADDYEAILESIIYQDSVQYRTACDEF